MQTVLFNDGKTIEWGKPDSFATAAMSALSMSFPAGEDFFVEALKKSYVALPNELKEKWKVEINRFCEEETKHSRAHVIHNKKNCSAFNLIDKWGPKATRRIAKMDDRDVRHYAAAVAATEHLTTVMGCWLLLNNHILENAPKETRALWIWHAIEEVGHRKVAIDVYRDLGGSEEWRIKWMRIIYTVTLIDFIQQTLYNIWRMKGFFKLSTWVNAYKILFGKGGIIRWSYPLFKAYGKKDYHINHHEELINHCLQQVK